MDTQFSPPFHLVFFPLLCGVASLSKVLQKHLIASISMDTDTTPSLDLEVSQSRRHLDKSTQFSHSGDDI